MFVLKNCSEPEHSQANSRARLGHLKQLLKIFSSPNVVSIISFTDEKIFTVITPKNLQNDRLYAYPSTKKKDVTKRLRTQSVTDGISRRVTSV